jgi:hypothetical protein
MDKRVEGLKSTEECANFVKNALRLGHPKIAQEARQRAVQIRAEAYGEVTPPEREALEAVYAYEAVISARNGKKTRASRTWDLVKRHGILGAVERAVAREEETAGYPALVEMGLDHYAFEAVVMRHPDLFSKESVERSSQRIAERQKTETVAG